MTYWTNEDVDRYYAEHPGLKLKSTSGIAFNPAEIEGNTIAPFGSVPSSTPDNGKKRGVERELRIVLNHLPYPELSPNSRVHWAVKARAVKALRQEVAILAWVDWKNGPPMERARICYEFHITTKRKRDADNLVAACKSAQDGLVDGGVLVADDSEHVHVYKAVVKYGHAYEETVITVEEC